MRVGSQNLGPLLRQLQSAGMTVIAADEVPPSLARLIPGHQVKAEVLSQLANGRTLVRVAGEALALNLPYPPGPGTLLDLTFLGAQPRLTFALADARQSEVKLDLSATGRWLTQPDTAKAAEGAPLPRIDRLLEGLAADPARLAQRLREVVGRSGLFYESHLLEWATGRRPLADLLAEPQGTLSPLLRETAEPETRPPAPPAPPPGDPRTLPLVKEQLALLADGQYLWRGEARQGEPLSWRIEQDGGGRGDEAERGWSTSLELELPAMGPVSAELRLRGQELTLALEAADEERAALLRAHAGSLREALAACGIQLTAVEVRHAAAR